MCVCEGKEIELKNKVQLFIRTIEVNNDKNKNYRLLTVSKLPLGKIESRKWATSHTTKRSLAPSA